MAETQAPQKRFRNLLVSLLMIFASIVVTLAVIEGCLRLYFTFFANEAARATYLYSADEALRVSGLYSGYPYLNYGLSPDHQQVNARGYRSPEFESPKPAGTFRIFTLGGSTTYGTGLQQHETYPSQLQEILRTSYDHPEIEVVNAGVESYSSFDSLANLAYHILDDEPDMILIYDNINDVRARLVDPASYSGLNLQRGIWSPAALDLRRSPFLVGRFIQRFLRTGANPNSWEAALAAGTNVVRCPFHMTECEGIGMSARQLLDTNTPIYFERNLRNMIAIARANGVTPVLSTWAYFREETELPNFLMIEHIQYAVNQHNEIIRALASELDVALIDLDREMPANVDFWQDGMHVTAAGATAQAEIYAARLIESDLLPVPGA